MRNLIRIFAAACLMAGTLQAQPPAPKPAATPPTAAKPTPAATPAPTPKPAAMATIQPAPSLKPFTGYIGYRITHTPPPAKPGTPKPTTKPYTGHLPDSMTLWINPPLIRATYHGGLSDSLETELQWDASQHRYFLIDRVAAVAWTLDDQFQVAPKLPMKALAKDSLAGFRLNVFEVPVPGGKDRYSITDSIHFPFILAADSLRDSLMHLVPPFLLPGQQCIPLRITRSTAAGTTETKAVTISRQALEERKFRLPAGFDVKPFDPLVRFHPLVPKPVEAPR